jgi:3-hydroxypropionyl-CoA synthetase (ADP-forming)
MMLKQYGFLVPRRETVASAEAAVAAARRIGFPVVMKIVSADLIHKTDVGGVELGVGSARQVEAAYSRIIESVGQKAPQARIEGVSVEEMCLEGIEIIVGLINDRQFGPTIMFGLGGVLTELLEDVSFRVLPISHHDALDMIEEIKGRRILEGFRGSAPVSKDLVADLLVNAGRMGYDLGDRLESIDLNPILVWGNQHRVLDAKFILKPPAGFIPVDPARTEHLDMFFMARSVALIGASPTEGKIGNAVLDSLINHEYQGKVYPVNPSHSEIMDLRSWPTLSAIEDQVDLVVVTVGLTKVPDILHECAAKGIHNMVIVSGGGKELGGSSQDLERSIRELAEQVAVRIVGCNCIGVFDGQARLDTFFQVHERMARPRNGPIAMLSQSGTVGAAFLEDARDIGVSKFVSYGNRIDVDEADLIAYLGNDVHTRVIACYVEGLENGRKFLNTARDVAQRKPIVVFKSGRSKQGARASVSHTGFFGGSYGVVKGAFRQAGLIAVDSCDELYAVAKALGLQPVPAGSRVAMIGNGAGTMVQGLDMLESCGLEMADLSPDTIRHLSQVYPAFYIIQNPLDVTGSASSGDYETGIRALLEDPNVDIVMPWFVFQDTPLGEDIVEVLDRLSRSHNKPIVCGAIGGDYTRKMGRALEEKRVPVYFSVREWMCAASGLAAWGRRRAALSQEG